MGSFIIRRVFYAIIMLIVVSFVSFVIISLPAGDFLDQKIAELQARGDQSAANRIDEYRERYGLDQPILTQYWIWISNFVQGDFGLSFQFERPVRELIGQRLGLSIVLSLSTLIFNLGHRHPTGCIFGCKPVFTWRPNHHDNSIYWPGDTGVFVSPARFILRCGCPWSGCSGIVFTEVCRRALEPG